MNDFDTLNKNSKKSNFFDSGNNKVKIDSYDFIAIDDAKKNSNNYDSNNYDLNNADNILDNIDNEDRKIKEKENNKIDVNKDNESNYLSVNKLLEVNVNYIPSYIEKKSKEEEKNTYDNIAIESLYTVKSQFNKYFLLYMLKNSLIIISIGVFFIFFISIKLSYSISFNKGNEFKDIISKRSFNLNLLMSYYYKLLYDVNSDYNGNNNDNNKNNKKNDFNINYSKLIEVQLGESFLRTYEIIVNDHLDKNVDISNKENFSDPNFLFKFYFNQTDALENSIQLLVSKNNEATLKDFISFENSLNSNKIDVICQNLYEYLGEEYHSTFETDCFIYKNNNSTNNTTSSSNITKTLNLKDNIRQISRYLENNANRFKNQIISLNSLINRSPQQLNLNEKYSKMMFSMILLLDKNVFIQNDSINFNINPSIEKENEIIFNSIVSFIESISTLDYILNPILLLICISNIYVIYSFYRSLNNDINSIFKAIRFLPKECLDNNKYVEELTKDLVEEFKS